MEVQATSYSFNAGAKTITFTTLVPASLEAIREVVNATTGALLYRPVAGAGFTGTYASPVLTLACSTAGMSNTDRLLIIVDDGLSPGGTVTANAGTNLNTSALAVESGGNLAGINAKLPSLDSGRIPVVLPAGGSGLTDTELRASAVPVSAASLPLPSGAATQTTLAAVNDKIPALLTATPVNGVSAPPMRVVGQDTWVCSFAGVGASIISNDFTAPVVGTGVGYSQAGGSLLITTGTSTNAEFFTRSVQAWRGSLRMRFSLVASQRIANQNLQITLADLIGSALTYTIVSATVVDVTMTAHGYTAQNVGQFMNIGGITGAAGVPGRYAIASIPDANTIRFTVAGWPGSGSGTLTLFGWNYVRNLVNGTTPTAIGWDTQRRGWAVGDTTATINTTASPGTIVQNDLNGRDVFLMDQLRATATAPTFTTRASRYENLPDDETVLYVFIWSYNGTSAPASTTTWTLGFISVEKFANQPVYIQGARANGTANALPVIFPAAQAVSGTVTANQGTMVALPAGANAVGDVGVQYRANATGAASFANVLSPATPVAQQIKSGAGRLLSITVTNTNAAARFLKLWNTAVGSITVGTTAALAEIAIPPNQTITLNLDGGIGFSTAICVAVTGGQGLTNSTAVTLGDVTGLIAFA